MQPFNACTHPQKGRDFARVTKRAQAASPGRRAAERTSGAPTVPEATIAAAQSGAFAQKCLRFIRGFLGSCNLRETMAPST